MQKPGMLHWSLLGFLSLVWGLAFFLIAVALEAFGPLTVVSIRLAVGAITLYAVMRWQGYKLPPLGPWWPRFALLAALGNIIPFTLIAWAETRITSAHAGLLMALMPISTIVLAHFYVHGDQMTRSKLAGVAMGFAGVAVLVGGNFVGGDQSSDVFAQIVVLVATLSYAVNSIYTKRLPEMSVLVMGTGSLLIGAFITLPVSLALESQPVLSSALPQLLAALLLGVFSTGLATWAFFRVIMDCGPSFLALINYIIPAIAFAAGVVFLEEAATGSQFLGLVIILLGIALTQQRTSSN